MTQFTTRPENEAKRLKAFELFIGAGTEGRRRSIRSIAQELGVGLSTVQYWQRQDEWDLKLHNALAERARTASQNSAYVKMMLRRSLVTGIAALERVIAEGKPMEKVAAVRELAHAASRLAAVDLGVPGAAGDADVLPQWTDDVPDTTDTPPAEEPDAPAPEPVDEPVE